ncbi:MAG: 3-hydroxyacyl-CoA dehydrogenase NAD-binding domain-containing protein [Bacteroidetes bacterium]|nr:3-hydroxyacyl-CoA dehydrogenase NAD-binding domain-containing protein [Bacteroidota bacterium]
MRIQEIKSVAVVGAGTMGQGIAQVAAMAGFETLLFDINKRIIDKAFKQIRNNLDKGISRGKVTKQHKEQTLTKLHSTSELSKVRADLIVEAVLEDLGLKQKLFGQLEDINQNHTIFATNTSSIPVSKIGERLRYPERLVGLHFFNPAHIMKLVEVVSSKATDPQVAEFVMGFAEKLGKIPVMTMDSPGFIVNRVARHFYVEGLRILEDGVADIKTIDLLIESCGFRMGPFRLMDLIGVDTNLAVTRSIYLGFNQHPKFQPNPIQQNKVDAGLLGVKTGEGFYRY